MIKFFRILILLVLFVPIAKGQFVNQAGLSLGYTNYLGDLVVPNFTLNHSAPAAAIYAKKQLSRFFTLRGQLLYGSLKGNDLNYSRNYNRDISFVTHFVEFGVFAEYDLLGARRFPMNEQYRGILSPYLFWGVGVMATSKSIHYGQVDNPDSEAAYSLIHPSFPIGLGFKKDFRDTWVLGIEWGMRFTLSDFLDGVKYSGDPTNNDVYFFGGLSVSYFIKSPADFSQNDVDNPIKHPLYDGFPPRPIH